MKIRSAVRPKDVEIMTNSVLVASNITPYNEEVDGRVLSGYEYDCTEYSKDEYLLMQAGKVTSLEEELSAAKILLGVD